MIVLLRSTDGNPDSRFEKYINFLTNEAIPFMTICWDRNLICKDKPSSIYYHKKAGYGNGLKNVFKLIGFNYFILLNLIKYREEYRVIHACDFDTIVPAICMKLLFNKKVIYDIFDWYIDSRNINNMIIKYILLLIEYVNIKLSDVVVICEEERRTQIIFEPKHLWILPNIPNFEDVTFMRNDNTKLTLSYVGILGYDRGLDKIVRLAKENRNIRLLIAGFGPLEYLLEDADKYENITYYGPVKYAEGLRIMSASDVICALYEKNNKNHIYAAPNKFYEGLFLGKPIITTKGTLVGDKTDKLKTGFSIGESYTDLCNVVSTLTPSLVNEIGFRAFVLWNSDYKSFVKDFLNLTYKKYILDN